MEILTLLLCLVLLLVLCKQHVVWQTATRNSSLQTHAMALARQAPRAESAIRQRHTTLPLHIDGSLRLCAFGFGFVLLLFLRVGPLLCAIFNLALLALLGAFAVHYGALDG
jgi:hypothetical protein